MLPWRDEVSAVLLSWFGGQEYGAALADILLGVAEPGGRLPTTWPAEQADVPVIEVTPVDGIVAYEEGIHIGYRAWLKAGARPAYEFGHGLGFTTFQLAKLRAPATVRADDSFEACVDVTNTGARAGKAVVQIYAERADSSVNHPVRWLVGFAALWIEAGQSAVAQITVPTRALANWDDGWRYETGGFVLRAGTSVGVLPLDIVIEVEATDAS